MGIIDKVVSLFTTETTVADEWLQGVFKDVVTGPGPKRQAAGFLKAYSTHPIFRRAEQQIAIGVASLEWKVYAQRRGNTLSRKNKTLTLREAVQGGGEWSHPTQVQRGMDKAARDRWLKRTKAAGELVEIDNHPLLGVLNYTNTYFTGYLTRQLITMYIDTLGEAPLLKERGPGGQIVGLWPIPPHWVVRMPTPQRPTYGIAFGGGGAEASIPETEVLWMVDPDPHNPYLRGSGVGFTLADELDTSEAISKYKRAFFWNGARPDFIVQIDGIGRRDLRKYSAGWNAQHRGFWKAFKAHFINKAITIHQLGDGDLQKQDISQLTKDERDIFIQTIGIPPEKMFISENSNRATALAADITMAKDVIMPRGEFQRAYFQEKLVPEFDERLVLDFENPTPEDPEFRLKAAQAKPETVMVDEWRELQGLGAVEDGSGQRFLVGTVGVQAIETFEDLEQDESMVPPVDPFGQQPPEGPPDESEEDEEDPQEDEKPEPEDSEGDSQE